MYLPRGEWIDYQRGEAHEGGRWCEPGAGEVPVIAPAREGAAILRAAVAQCTDEIDWSNLELAVFGAREYVEAAVCLPGDDEPRRVGIQCNRVARDAFEGSVSWDVTRVTG